MEKLLIRCTEWLHGKLQEFVEEKQGNTYTNSRKHLKIDPTSLSMDQSAGYSLGRRKIRRLEGRAPHPLPQYLPSAAAAARCGSFTPTSCARAGR